MYLTAELLKSSSVSRVYIFSFWAESQSPLFGLMNWGHVISFRNLVIWGVGHCSVGSVPTVLMPWCWGKGECCTTWRLGLSSKIRFLCGLEGWVWGEVRVLVANCSRKLWRLAVRNLYLVMLVWVGSRSVILVIIFVFGRLALNSEMSETYLKVGGWMRDVSKELRLVEGGATLLGFLLDHHFLLIGFVHSFTIQ